MNIKKADVLYKLNKAGLLRFMSDEKYITKMFQYRMGYSPDLRNPKTYSEKLQWLKIHDRNPLLTLLVDKKEVKTWVASKIGEEYVIPTIGVWDNVDDIEYDMLPNQFVLKCIHDSGGIYICKNKDTLCKEIANKLLRKHLKQNYYKNGREWPYKNVKPQIIAEPYLEDERTKELRDYKFFVFDGKVRLLFVATDRQNPKEDTKFDFFDENYIWLDVRQGHPNAVKPPEKPINFELMKQLAEILGEQFCEVRVDFYEVNGKVYFGEMTFFHHGGWTPFDPSEYDEQLGQYIDLSVFHNSNSKK